MNIPVLFSGGELAFAPTSSILTFGAIQSDTSVTKRIFIVLSMHTIQTGLPPWNNT
jgi:hypothetical protein